MVRGVESGGAAGDIGRYVTFAKEVGQAIECLHAFIDATVSTALPGLRVMAYGVIVNGSLIIDPIRVIWRFRGGCGAEVARSKQHHGWK